MAIKKFHVGVKGIIHDERGVLLLKHAHSGWWESPGGRLDDDEDLEDALVRELGEELPGCRVLSVGKPLGAVRVHKDIEADISLALIYYPVQVELPSEIALSTEHTEMCWVKTIDELPEQMNETHRQVVAELLV